MDCDLNNRNIALELNYLNIVRISGRDAERFLNDQLTNDIDALEANRWQFTGYCTSKGRLIAVMRLFVSDDCVYIILPGSLSEAVIQRLQIYVFRAKVSFEILAGYRMFCLIGSDAVNRMGQIPAHEFHSDDNGIVLNISAALHRYLAIVKSADAVKGLERVSLIESQLLWRLAEIREMVPNIDVQTSELFIPQHVNLDRLNGVSFSKGCFPGQEVVARLHYLGKSKQVMKHIRIDSDQPLLPGQTLNHADFPKALKIVDAVQTHPQTYECLAVGQFDQHA